MTTLKPLTLRMTANCGVFLKRWEYQTTLPAYWETCMEVKKQQLELDMERLTGSKLGREYVKVVYCHPVYLTSMQSTSCKMLCWINHKLESRFPGEISITQVCRWHHSIVRKWRGITEPPEEVKEASEEAGLKFSIKTQTMASSPIASWKNHGFDPMGL